jgi:hypothetical protein
MQVPQKLKRFAPKAVRWRLRRAYEYPAETDWYWKVFRPGNDRTAYLIGLFGTGRLYVNDLMMQETGRRAKYFRDAIRHHQRPTSMIYSGHATIRYVSRHQALPSATRVILEAVRSRIADLIFIYRHPLDSLLSNWVYWRTYLHDNYGICISQVYRKPDDLWADLEEHFGEFEAFADGDPRFFAVAPGLPFLSFREFVEETELYLQSATLALRFEDFMSDPAKEFSKIAQLLSVSRALSHVPLQRPLSKPFRYLTAEKAVPRFKAFIDGLDAETKRRIERIGYTLR